MCVWRWKFIWVRIFRNDHAEQNVSILNARILLIFISRRRRHGLFTSAFSIDKSNCKYCLLDITSKSTFKTQHVRSHLQTASRTLGPRMCITLHAAHAVFDQRNEDNLNFVVNLYIAVLTVTHESIWMGVYRLFCSRQPHWWLLPQPFSQPNPDLKKNVQLVPTANMPHYILTNVETMKDRIYSAPHVSTANSYVILKPNIPNKSSRKRWLLRLDPHASSTKPQGCNGAFFAGTVSILILIFY